MSNGPDALTTGGNAQLVRQRRGYSQGIETEGPSAFWSAVRDTAFEKLLAGAGFTVEVHRLSRRIDSADGVDLFGKATILTRLVRGKTLYKESDF